MSHNIFFHRLNTKKLEPRCTQHLAFLVVQVYSVKWKQGSCCFLSEFSINQLWQNRAHGSHRVSGYADDCHSSVRGKNSLQNMRNFLRFQASGGKRETNAER